MSSAPPPRPPPAMLCNSYEMPGQLMSGNHFLGGYQSPFLSGYQPNGYSMCDP